jgi:hypothetical protein
VHKSANVPINQLKAQFFDKLQARSLVVPPVLVGVGGMAPATKLTLDELIQNSASMEFDALPPNSEVIGGYDTDVKHVLVRHARRAESRQGAPGNNNTGFFPKTATRADIVDIIAASILDCGVGKAKPPGPVKPLPHGNPPLRQDDLNNAGGRQYGGVVGLGYTGTIGFKKKAPNSAAGAVQVGQYYPTAGPGVVSVSADDLAAIKLALNK